MWRIGQLRSAITNATRPPPIVARITPMRDPIQEQYLTRRSTQTIAQVTRKGSIQRDRRRWASAPLHPTCTASAASNLLLSCPSPYFIPASHIHQGCASSSSSSSSADVTTTGATSSNTPTASNSASSLVGPSIPTEPQPKLKSSRSLKTIRYDLMRGLEARVPWLPQWMTLIKIELSFVVTVSSFFGMAMAGSEAWSFTHVAANFIGTALCAASAAIGNQYIEREYDALMPRTKLRPLVTGKISKTQALVAAFLLPVPGAALLHYASAGDLVAPALGLLTIVSYVGIYTPLKRLHRWNTELGAIVGSVPVLIGWSCAISHWSHHMIETHQMHLPFTTLQSLTMPHAMYGFLFLVAWQMQHFMTIAFNYQEQYAKAGYVMMRDSAALHKGMAWTTILCLMPFGAVYFGVASKMLLVTGSAINGLLVAAYYKWWRAMKSTDESARNKAAKACMGWGIVYFMIMFSAIIYHSLDNKYHLFMNLIPPTLRDVAFSFCPVAWRQEVPVPAQASELPFEKTHSPQPEAHLHDGKLCTIQHTKNDSKCIYMQLVHPETLQQLEPKAAKSEESTKAK